MSYEDLNQARANRAAKDSASKAKGKGKRGRKRKSSEATASEPYRAPVARMIGDD